MRTVVERILQCGLSLAAAAMASGASAQTVCDVHAYGAKGDGTTKDTAAIQAAIDDCAGKGGGAVVLKDSKVFLSAPIILKSNITLQVASGTTLQASEDHDDFPQKEEFRSHGRQALITAKDAENLVITGGGVIDGRGESWWLFATENTPRPRLVVFDHCKHVRMEGVTVQNSPMWQIVPYYSDDLQFRNMQVLAPAHSHNTDGIDPFSSSHVVIDHVTIDTGDDNIAIKSGQPGSAGPDAPSTDIVITDCIFLNGHGLSIGSEIAGGVQNVHAERIEFRGTTNGIRIKSGRDRGGDIGNFVFKDISMLDVKTPITVTAFYPKIPKSISEEAVTRLTPHMHDIAFVNLTAKGAHNAAVIVGLPEAPIQNLILKNVAVTGEIGAELQYVHFVSEKLSVRVEGGGKRKAFLVGPEVYGNLEDSATAAP
jgi:polygalacturonase